MDNPVPLIEKLAEFEVPPPGPGLKTVTATELVVAMSAAGMEASSCVLLIYVVVRLVPFQRTIELEIKLLPVTRMIIPGVPVAALLGDKLAIDGTGLEVAGADDFEGPQPKISCRKSKQNPNSSIV